VACSVCRQKGRRGDSDLLREEGPGVPLPALVLRLEQHQHAHGAPRANTMPWELKPRAGAKGTGKGKGSTTSASVSLARTHDNKIIPGSSGVVPTVPGAYSHSSAQKKRKKEKDGGSRTPTLERRRPSSPWGNVPKVRRPPASMQRQTLWTSTMSA